MNTVWQRRRFLQTGTMGVAALVIGCKGDGTPTLVADAGGDTLLPPPDTNPPLPAPPAGEKCWAWIRIATDNTAYLAVNKAEMGQGIATGLAMLIAEELDLDWSNVQVILEPEIDTFYMKSTGRSGTAESSSIRGHFKALRRIGAAARAVLITAAANQWGVDASSLTTANGEVQHPDGSVLSYGELVASTAGIEVPKDPPLKASSDFRLIGTSPPPADLNDIVEGERVYGIDVEVDNMLYAAVRHAPVTGGVLTNFSELTVDGTDAIAVVEVPGGLAVVANSYWTANNVVKSLPAVFEAAAELTAFSTETYSQQLSAALEDPGSMSKALDDGDVDAALASAAQTVDVEYEVPFLAHACMEPMTATAHVTPSGCTVWAPTQGANSLRKAVGDALNIDVEAITIHRTYAGTGFGRKVETDFGVQAAIIAQAVGQPVKLIWSREEDIKNDFYRPGFKVRMKGGLTEDGSLDAWHAISAGESIFSDRGLTLPIDPISVDGLIRLEGFVFQPLLYTIPNQRVNYVPIQSPLRVGFWRSVGNSQNTFFVESFLDELADKAGADPLEFRLQLLSNDARAVAVVERLKEAASWGSPVTPGASQGMAFTYAYESYFAVAVEVTVTDKKIQVHRATGVVDCGQVIHPDLVAAQLEGGIIFGQGAGMLNAITVKNGEVQQSNFFDFPMPLMRDAPTIQIERIDSNEDPGGIGELSVGPAAPAIANAVFQATGQRLRTLPLQLS